MLKLLAAVVVLIWLGAVTDGSSLVVRREKREEIAKTEYGSISGVEIKDGIKGPYHLQFVTLDPNSMFLPVLLHADMVFYVQSGSGSLSWSDEDGTNQIDVSKGDVYRIPSGSIFFVKSNLEAERERLRICSIFTNPDNLDHSHELDSVPYSTMPDLITGFDTKVLQAAFQVSEEVIDTIRNTTNSPPIVHVPSTNKTDHTNWTERILKILTGGGLESVSNNKKKKRTKIFNILNSKPDFQNCNGWSKTVNKKDLKALKGSNIGVFMVNLTEGSMMGPHWNPRASEIAIVLQGQGMVHMVCSSMMNVSECKNRRFKVKEGDVFAVPKFHPMAQMAYNNETFVFMGFSTMGKPNYPQFLAGKSSVLQTLDKDVLAMSFNVSNATVTELLSSQGESIILGCVSCAEEEEMRMQQEIEKERQEEEAKKRKEEEERKREEEEAKKKREEEERKREEEEARKKREEEERKRQEEEEERKRQEEEAKKKEEEEERRREEEEAAQKEAEKEAAEEARRKEEEERKREEKEAAQREAKKEAAEEARKREEEERKREEEEAAQREAEKAAEEEAKRREEEEERKREEEEVAQREAEKEAAEAQRKREEEERRSEEAEAQRKQEEEEQRREEAARQEQGEAARQEQEREERRREEEEAERQGEGQGREEEARRGRKEGRREGGGGGGLRKIFIF